MNNIRLDTSDGDIPMSALVLFVMVTIAPLGWMFLTSYLRGEAVLSSTTYRIRPKENRLIIEVFFLGLWFSLKNSGYSLDFGSMEDAERYLATHLERVKASYNLRATKTKTIQVQSLK